MCKLNVGAYYKGYHSDSAKTTDSAISEEDRKLIEVAKENYTMKA